MGLVTKNQKFAMYCRVGKSENALKLEQEREREFKILLNRLNSTKNIANRKEAFYDKSSSVCKV